MRSAVTSFFLRRTKPLALHLPFVLVLLVVAIPASAGSGLGVGTANPGDGQTVSGSITWEATVSSANVDRVEFAIDGVVKWTEHSAPWLFNGVAGGLTTTALPDGTHQLMAKAYSKNGKATGSTTVTVTVSNTASAPPPPPPPPITPQPPASSTLPSISGTVAVGQTLSASTGTWSGSTPMTYSDSWVRCDSSGGNCSPISGATSPTYVVTSADVGSTLRVTVTATNSAGSATATSAPSSAVAPVPSAPTSPLGTSLPARMPESSGSAYFVSTTGSDTNPGTFSAPWRTLQHAFAAVSSGAVINLRGGTYGGAVMLQNRSFSSSNPVTIQSYPGETATFTGDPTRECYSALYLGNVTGLRLRRLQMSASYGNGYKLDDVAHVEIDKSRVVNNGCQGILVVGNTVSSWSSSSTYSSDVQIWNSTFSHNGGYYPGNETYGQTRGDHSIYMGGGPLDGTQHGVVGGVIANNVIYDQHTGYGIQLGQSAWNIIVTNNTIDHAYNNCCNDDAGDGIMVFNSGSGNFPTRNVLIVNNLLTNNYAHGVYSCESVNMTSNVVRNNLSYGNGMTNYEPVYGNYLGFTVGTNLPDANPLYADRASHDFHLQPGSPASGKADPAYAPPLDADGRARPNAPAVGAFE